MVLSIRAMCKCSQQCHSLPHSFYHIPIPLFHPFPTRPLQVTISLVIWFIIPIFLLHKFLYFFYTNTCVLPNIPFFLTWTETYYLRYSIELFFSHLTVCPGNHFTRRDLSHLSILSFSFYIAVYYYSMCGYTHHIYPTTLRCMGIQVVSNILQLQTMLQ